MISSAAAAIAWPAPSSASTARAMPSMCAHLCWRDGRAIGLTDVTVAKEFRDDLRESACRRFTTVLGPGSDGYHEAAYSSRSRSSAAKVTACASGMCANRRPTEVAARVPLPLPRPAIPDAAINHERKL